jgi:hypothetical protein
MSVSSEEGTDAGVCEGAGVAVGATVGDGVDALVGVGAGVAVVVGIRVGGGVAVAVGIGVGVGGTRAAGRQALMLAGTTHRRPTHAMPTPRVLKNHLSVLRYLRISTVHDTITHTPTAHMCRDEIGYAWTP